MKHYYIIIFFILTLSRVYSQKSIQEVISASGDDYKGNKISLSWSLGEVAIETYDGGTAILTQGFHQGKYTLTNINSKKKYENITIYPNPCIDHITIDKSSSKEEKIILVITDLNGKCVLKKEISEYKYELNINMLNENIYLIQILNHKNKLIKSFKLEKVEK